MNNMQNSKELSPEEIWEQATLANNFIFYKVMRHHPDACKKLIEMLLDIKIEKMEMHNEETIDLDHDKKGIRLDVFVKEENRMYDIELQVVNTKELQKRARYYAGLMALDSLKSGELYGSLRDSHVIFICMEDIFNHNLPVYSFENICKEDYKVMLNDGDYKHFSNHFVIDVYRSSRVFAPNTMEKKRSPDSFSVIRTRQDLATEVVPVFPPYITTPSGRGYSLSR